MSVSRALATVSRFVSTRSTVDLFLGPAAITLALLFSLLMPVREAQAQTLTADGLSWGVAKSGPDSATVQNGALAIASTFALTAAWYGVTKVTPIGRTVTTAAAVVGPIAANMLRQAAAKGPLTGAMLALAVALGSDAVYDAATNTFKAPVKPTDGSQGFTWQSSFTGTYANNPQAVCDAESVTFGRTLKAVDPSNSAAASVYYCYYDGANNGQFIYSSGRQANRSPNCQTGYVKSGSVCVSTQLGTADDTQLATAAQAATALPKVWDAAGTEDRDKLIGGGTPGTPTFPSGNTVTFPTQTTTGAGTDAQGRPFNGTVSTVPGFQINANTGADKLANPATVTPTQTRTWAGTDSAGNPVNQSSTVTFPPQNVAIPNQQQAVSPASAPSIDTCGLPGKPKCLIDETGTPNAEGKFTQSTSELAQARADAITQMQDAAKVTSFALSVPTLLPGGSCQPIQFFKWKEFDGTVDLCERLGFIRTLLGWLWGALAAIYIYNRVSSANA
ncbi:hypothetical protein ACIP1U_11165 [Cupriavidus sp. NPDC089707]|uniref:hypothetical protein n=1 Tax=Cupriavidus sp. NPDC089707 TaxID=3363963 RepID=UPI0038228681